MLVIDKPPLHMEVELSYYTHIPMVQLEQHSYGEALLDNSQLQMNDHRDSNDWARTT